METHENEDATSMADKGDAGALRRDSLPRDTRGDGELLPGSLHAVRARGDGTPLGGGAPAGARAAVSRDRRADGRIDDDGDARGALAPQRRGRLSSGARPNGLLSPSPDGAARKLRVAVPAKGR